MKIFCGILQRMPRPIQSVIGADPWPATLDVRIHIRISFGPVGIGTHFGPSDGASAPWPLIEGVSYPCADLESKPARGLRAEGPI